MLLDFNPWTTNCRGTSQPPAIPCKKSHCTWGGGVQIKQTLPLITELSELVICSLVLESNGWFELLQGRENFLCFWESIVAVLAKRCKPSLGRTATGCSGFFRGTGTLELLTEMGGLWIPWEIRATSLVIRGTTGSTNRRALLLAVEEIKFRSAELPRRCLRWIRVETRGRVR